jgi:transcriptional regulator with XRE-family HTH domain
LVQVDYEAIDLLLQARKMSRRQLAKLLGISPDTLAGSFRRGSKMKVFQLWQIANILSVKPTDLLATDEDGHYSNEDIEKVESEKFESEFLISEDNIGDIDIILEKLNPKGLQIIKTIAAEFSKIPEFQANYSLLKSTYSGEGFILPDEEGDD